MVKMLQVRVLAGAAGEFFSPELTFCADSHLVSVPLLVTAVARKRHAYTLDPRKSEWADYVVQA